jgi:hypothetical protein
MRARGERLCVNWGNDYLWKTSVGHLFLWITTPGSHTPVGDNGRLILVDMSV